MNQRTTVVLLVLFFGGLIGLWWAGSAKIPDYRQRQMMSGRVLPELVDVLPDEVRRVEISGGERLLVLARRADGRWQMIEPVDTLADRSKVDLLLGNLKDLRKNADVRTIAGPAATYGLDRPVRVVRLFGADPTAPLAGLELGRTLGDQRYVRPLGQDGIEVAEAPRLSLLELPVADWRERALSGLSPYDVETLTVTGPGHELSVKLVDGRWRLARPFEAPADPHKVEGVLADLAALRVVDTNKGFVADDVRDMTPYGLDPPRLRIEATTLSGPGKPPGRAEVILIGTDVPGQVDRAYARRGDQDDVVLVDVRPLRDLGADPLELRSRKVADFDPDHAEFLRVRAGSVAHELARGPDGWTILGSEGARADSPVVAELLTRLNDLQSSEFLDPKAVDRPELDPPGATVQVWLHNPAVPTSSRTPTALPEGPPDVDLQLGRHDALRKAVYARMPGDPSTLVLPDQFLEALPRDALAFRPRTLVAQDTKLIDRVMVRLAGRPAVVVAPAAAAGGGWQMTAPVRARVDPEALARLTVLLSRLRADRLVDAHPDDLKRYGLDAPGLVVSWTLRGAAARPTGTAGGESSLSVGQVVPRSTGARYATLSGDPMVFTIKPEAFAILAAELRDRRVLAFAPDQAARVTVTWPDRSFAFAPRARPSADDPSPWEVELGSGPPGFELSRVEALVTALLPNLRAPRFTQYLGPFPAEAGLAPPLATIRVQLKGDDGTKELRLGNPAGPGLRFATTESASSGAVFVLSEAEWAPYLPAAQPGPRVLPENVFAP